MRSEFTPVVYGCAGEELNEEEISFFEHNRPLGLILFTRNCKSEIQIKSLIEHFKEVTGNPNALILIDMEGGRVARLKAPLWPEFPPASHFMNMAINEGLDKAGKAVNRNYAQMAAVLSNLGINVNCAPVCDLLFDDAHDIIGDRAFGKNPDMAASLAEQVCAGLKSGGVWPVIKHIPGHGRASLDSHEALPIVTSSFDELDATDFEVFRKLSDAAFGMTAHILYTALDAEFPATLSPTIIEIIRNHIGFTGILFSDDISMKALNGNLDSLSAQALNAGCDIVLHCNGKMEEMLSVAKGVGVANKMLMARLPFAIA